MSSHKYDSTSQAPDHVDGAEVPADTLGRCAELISAGEMDWPAGLSAAQESVLLAEVRQRRRGRLVRLIASSIAADIERSQRGGTQESAP